MRMVLAAAAALAVFTVAGCDINTGTPKETKVGCNCTTPPAATPAPPASEPYYAPPAPRHHRWHGHGYARTYGGVHGYAWRRDYSEISVETYDYRSDSHSYVTGESSDSGTYSGAGAYAGGGAGGSEHGGWVDGYGRGHGGATAGDAVHDDRAIVDRARMAPWRGYDIDCPDNDPHALH